LISIVENEEAPTFKNTIEALDFSYTLDRLSSIFFNLNSAETNDEIQKIAQEVSPLLSDFGNDIRLNAKLFTKVKAVHEQKATLNLNTEQTTLLDEKIQSFSRNGANLAEDKKTLKLTKLSKTSLQFGTAETQGFNCISRMKNLSGLPEGTIEAARSLAKSQRLDLHARLP
jgi:peptidyl-dipeptidase Dcp